VGTEVRGRRGGRATGEVKGQKVMGMGREGTGDDGYRSGGDMGVHPP